MTRLARLFALVALWGASLYGATRVHTLELPLGHGICGPWGCAAEPEALLGYHLFWLALLAPAVSLGCRVLPRDTGRKAAFLVAGSGLAGVVAIAARGSIAWIAGGEAPRYALQRGLFDVATTPDLPVIPLLISGLAAWFFVRDAVPGDGRTENPPKGSCQPDGVSSAAR